MTDYVISVTIDGDDQLTTPANSAKSAVAELGTAAQTSGNRVRRMADDTKKAGDNANIATPFFNDLNGVVGGFIAGIGIQTVANFAGQLMDMGRQAAIAETAFEELGLTTADLDRLRDATRGVVDDATLMRGAAQMMAMGLASSGEQAAELMEIGTGLGAVLGVEATDALTNFNAALANQSYERLDMLGISAGAVRQRVAELRAEGLDMAEAFSQATLEQGRAAMERFGSAVDMTAAPMDRFLANLRNIGADVGTVLANGLDETIEGVEAFGGAMENANLALFTALNGEMAGWRRAFQIHNVQMLNDMTSDFMSSTQGMNFDLFGDGVDSSEQVLNTLTDMSYAAHRVMESTGSLPVHASEIEASYREITGYAGEWTMQMQAAAQYAIGTMRDIQSAAIAEEEAAEAARNRAAAHARQNMEAREGREIAAGEEADLAALEHRQEQAAQAERERIAERERAVAELAETEAAALDELEASRARARAEERARAAERQREIDELAAAEAGVIDAQNFSAIETSIGNATASLTEMQGVVDSTRGMIGDTLLFSPEEAQRLDDAATTIEDQLAAAQEMHDQGLISDTQLANLENAATEARDLADAAADGAQAFADMSLTELFQQTDGGAFADATELIMDELEAMGVEGEQADAIQQSFDLASGAQTQSSVAFEEEVVPMIVGIIAEQGEAVGVALLDQFMSEITALRLAGATDAEIAAATSAFAASGGASMPLATATTTATTDTMAAGETTIAGEGAAAEEAGMVGGQTLPDAIMSAEDLGMKLTTLTEQIATLTSTVHRVQFEFSLVNQPGQVGIDWLTSALPVVVQNNGGIVPGSIGS